MEVERIFSADQIKVHPELGKILRQYTKAVIKEDPIDILEFSYSYFKKLVEQEEEQKLKLLKKQHEELQTFN
eukprot:gene10436-14019_t